MSEDMSEVMAEHAAKVAEAADKEARAKDRMETNRRAEMARRRAADVASVVSLTGAHLAPHESASGPTVTVDPPPSDHGTRAQPRPPGMRHPPFPKRHTHSAY